MQYLAYVLCLSMVLTHAGGLVSADSVMNNPNNKSFQEFFKENPEKFNEILKHVGTAEMVTQPQINEDTETSVDVPFETVHSSILSADERKIISSHEKYQGSYQLKKDDHTLIFIFAGSVPDSSYKLDVSSANLEEETLKIKVSIKSEKNMDSSKNKYYTPVISYPHLILKVSESFENYEVIFENQINSLKVPKGVDR